MPRFVRNVRIKNYSNLIILQVMLNNVTDVFGVFFVHFNIDFMCFDFPW